MRTETITNFKHQFIIKKTALYIFVICLYSCNPNQEKRSTSIETKVYTEVPAKHTVKETPPKAENATEQVEELYLKEEEKEQSITLKSEAFKPAPFIAKILEQLDIQPVAVYEEFIVQKVLPYDITSTVVIIPTIASVEDDGYSFSLHSYVLVVDSETASIKQQFYESESWYSDAIRIEEISIDTANYKVAEGKRAFGVELFYIGASNPNPYNSGSISLFMPDEHKLVKVLDSFEIHSYWGEWDMRCTGEFISVHKTLIMDSNQTEGFYDIQVRIDTTTMETFAKGEDDCDEKETTQKSQQTLKYKKGKYEISKKVYTLETESVCGLQIVLEGDRYHMKTNKREHSGTFLVKDGSITFKGLLTDDPKVEVQGAYDGNEIIIQNYGNAMNPFTVFKECADQKYLHLVKKE
ncbi:hypothetical protein [Aquimarina sp. MMG016]|uniref:hypothetical protein n=1 Tax=Aquimarina sp. MMG016 TaxID=2822690 RepID=UPI001B3A72B4|nr:hypothetical protein [Aquimarina sp. MMG016]MBQ4819632.1 hypothetical protein [Aquimarina sp. MMG016]